MKVVHALGWYFPDALGGTEVYVAALAKRLQAAGHEALIAAPKAGLAAPSEYRHDGARVFRYPIPESPTRTETRGYQPVRGVELLHAFLSKERPDVFHCHAFVTGLGSAELAAAKSAGAAVVATTHSSSLGWICQRGTMMRWGESLCDGVAAPAKCAACELQHRGLPRPAARALGAIPVALAARLGSLPGKFGSALGMSSQIAANQTRQAAMLASVDAFVVLTEWARQAVLANGAPPEKVRLNRLGMSQSGFAVKPPPSVRPTGSPVVAGYLGRLDPIKGVLDCARAVASLPRDLPLRFEFCGPAESETARKVKIELQSILGDDDRWSFPPAIRPEEAPSLLSRWDVACFAPRCLEGGPTAAIEAIAVGTPVVGTKIGGLAELVADGVSGRLVPPGDVASLAAVLREIASAPESVDRWRAALPKARTMDDVAADYLALYESLRARIVARSA